MLPRYTRMTTATTHTTDSDAQVASAVFHEKDGNSISTTIRPAVMTNPAAIARRAVSNVTVANEATITTPTAAAVKS